MADLLSSVIAVHGGLDRWRTVRAIDVTFNFSGGLLDLKGYPRHRRPSASVDAATPRTVFQRLGNESDERWIFTPNLVWIERRDGTIVEERSDPRAAFAGHVRETPWDRLHLTRACTPACDRGLGPRWPRRPAASSTRRGNRSKDSGDSRGCPVPVLHGNRSWDRGRPTAFRSHLPRGAPARCGGIRSPTARGDRVVVEGRWRGTPAS